MQPVNQTRDFVYVKDVARANLLALKSDLIGAVNISTGREISINETFAMLKKITGSSLPEKHGPELPGEQLRSVLSYEKAKQNISWSPIISFKEGLKETVDSFRNFEK